MKGLKILTVGLLVLIGTVAESQAQGDYFRRSRHGRKVRMEQLLTVPMDPMQIDDDSSAVLKKELKLYADNCYKKQKNRMVWGTTMICIGSASLLGYAVYWPVGVAGTALLATGIGVVVSSAKHENRGRQLEARARELIVGTSFEPVQLVLGETRLDVGIAVLQNQQDLSSALGPSLSLRF